MTYEIFIQSLKNKFELVFLKLILFFLLQKYNIPKKYLYYVLAI